MTAPFRVLGDRVLVKPDLNENAPEVRESGVVLAQSMAAAVTGTDPTLSFSRGTVIAVGTPKHPLKEVAEDAARIIESGVDDADPEWAHLFRTLVRREPCVQPDDDVLFSQDAGQQITLDGETYVILHEHELLAVVE